MIRETQLMFKVNELKEIIPKNEWRYYYLQSVENFIYHLKSFKNERTRNRMAVEIEKYLEIVFEKLNQALHPQDKAKQLLPLIWKISITYQHELGFITVNYLWILLLLIPLFIFLNTTYNWAISLGVCIITFTIYAISRFIKVKSKKFY